MVVRISRILIAGITIAGIHAFIEESLEDLCSYCKEPHDAALIKEFYLNFQYLTGDCTKCGHTISIPQD